MELKQDSLVEQLKSLLAQQYRAITLMQQDMELRFRKVEALVAGKAPASTQADTTMQDLMTRIRDLQRELEKLCAQRRFQRRQPKPSPEFDRPMPRTTPARKIAILQLQFRGIR